MTTDIVFDQQRLHQGIGEIVVVFQHLEHEVAEVLASLLRMRHPSDTHRLTAAMSFGQKVDLMCDLYPERKNPAWPHLDIRITRDALKAAEAFRNTVVHSFWYFGGAERQWMRTKANLRSKGQLTISTGKVNLDALAEGARYLSAVGRWYLGETEKVLTAAGRLKALVSTLSEAKGNTNDA